MNICDYNVHIVGGGVCIYISEKWYDYCKVIDLATVIDKDYEILTVQIEKTNFKKIVLACVYRPPKGDIKNCIKFLRI